MNGGGKGLKSSRYQYLFDGKENTLTRGLHPEVSLNDAREKRNTAGAKLGVGTQPKLRFRGESGPA